MGFGWLFKTGLNFRHSGMAWVLSASRREPSSHGSMSRLIVTRATRSLASATSLIQMESEPNFPSSHMSRR